MWRLKNVVRSLLFAIGQRLYDRFYGLPYSERAAVVIRCMKCGGPVQIVEGMYDHISYQCLRCNILTDNVSIKLMPVHEAREQNLPAHVLM